MIYYFTFKIVYFISTLYFKNKNEIYKCVQPHFKTKYTNNINNSNCVQIISNLQCIVQYFYKNKKELLPEWVSNKNNY